MNFDHKIAIILSTFNGEKYLQEQLDSILSQTYSNYIVVVRDDGSEDSTLELLAKFSQEHPGKFKLLSSVDSNQGASRSFSSLMEYVLHNKQELGISSAYMMFADQDDVWVENKLERELELMWELELTTDELPILIHSDLKVVSSDRKEIAPSFIRYQGLNENKNGFGQQLISNLVTGCTMLINEPLAKKACPIPAGAIMHDWWCALVASAFGKTGFVSEQLVEYRQHEDNTLGARAHVRTSLMSKQLVSKLLNPPATSLLAEVAEQAELFRGQYSAVVSKRQSIQLSMVKRLRTRNAFIQRMLFRMLRVLLT